MHIGNSGIHRRQLLKGAGLATVLSFSPTFYRAALAAPAVAGEGPYGPLQDPDENGMMLPAGFTSRVVATSGLPVGTSAYVWHAFPDGAACFPLEDGGWHYVNNSEVPGGRGGVGGIRFAANGSVVDAYPVATGTSSNCAGGPTPWGTWLTCEEAGDLGQVWECDPSGATPAVAKPLLGSCNHEAVAVDPVNQHLFLTEDNGSGRFYRFVPAAYPSLDSGVLQAAKVDEDGAVTWLDIADPTATPLREQAPESTPFKGGEGIWWDSGFVYFTTKGDNKVWFHDIANQRIAVLYDAADFDDPPLTGVDNVTIAPSGDVLVAEDGGNLELVLISADKREVAPFMRLPGAEHAASEITGPCFSPDGTRLYFSSQRGGAPLAVPGLGGGLGVTYEVTGPFRLDRAGIAAVPSSQAANPIPSPAPRTSAPSRTSAVREWGEVKALLR